MEIVTRFSCHSRLDGMYGCKINELDNEIKKIKKHIEFNHKGTVFEPRDYHRELEIAFKERLNTKKVYDYLKNKCPV